MSGVTALITGASRGIGLAISKKLDESGYSVLGTATTEAGAAGISETLRNGTGLVLNASDGASIDAMFEKIISYHTLPLILINNAGITRDNVSLRMKRDEWDDVVTTNLTGLFRITKQCLRAMTKARWGRIVNLTSVVGFTGNPGQTNYAAAKAGIVGYSKSLAQEMGSRGITVNCIAPGLIATDMIKKISEKQRRDMVSRIPLGRLGEAVEIAHLVAFLVGENASYITGQTVHVNGGMYMN